jgi:hypothetical protein
MNILFVGPYKQQGEAGRKSRAILGALKRTSHNVTSRPLYIPDQFSVGQASAWAYSEEAEYSSCDEYDILIQFTSPVFAVYDGKFKKNIGIFNNQTIPTSPFCTDISRVDILDEIWVENERISEAVSNLSESKVSIIKPYMDTSLEKDVPMQRYPEGILRKNETFRDKFIFYTIGSLSEIEGVREALCAYFSEFSARDDCVLIHVLEHPLEHGAVNEHVEECFKLTGALRPLSEKPLIHVLNPDSNLPPEARLNIHKEGDCYVHPHYAVNCSSLILEAINSSSTPIVNKNTAAYDAWGEKSLWGIESYEEKCFLDSRKFDDLFTSNESWRRPIIASLAQQMREAYTNKFLRDSKKSHNAELKKQFESDEYYKSLEELLCLQ